MAVLPGLEGLITSQDKTSPAPLFKWVGGKRQLLDVIGPMVPDFPGTYFEPFIGAGAVLFHLRPQKAIISDLNPELVNVYNTVKTQAEVLIGRLGQVVHSREFFLETRKQNPKAMTDLDRAVRFLYLMRSCFNGVYRENSRGEFNTSMGTLKPGPLPFDPDNIRAVSRYLNENQVDIYNTGYEQHIAKAQPGDFVYLDPPYAPMSKTSNFSSYTKSGFGEKEQKDLAEACVALDQRGVKFLLSNSNSQVIHTLYAGFNIQVVNATRCVARTTSSRASAPVEVLVSNY